MNINFFLCYSENYNDSNPNKYILNYNYLGPWDNTNKEIKYSSEKLYSIKNNYTNNRSININEDKECIYIDNIIFKKKLNSDYFKRNSSEINYINKLWSFKNEWDNYSPFKYNNFNSVKINF